MEQGAINLARGAFANISADDVVEDLADGKEHSSRRQVDHGARLSKYTQDKNRLKHVERDKEDERHKLVQHVEGNVLVRQLAAVVPEASPVECGVQSNVASTDEESESGDDDQTKGQRSSVVDQLVPNNSVDHEDPCRCHDHTNMNGRESL